jgi:hypothetical protein
MSSNASPKKTLTNTKPQCLMRSRYTTYGGLVRLANDEMRVKCIGGTRSGNFNGPHAKTVRQLV